MRGRNALVGEVLHGLAGTGAAHLAYLNCLILQAVVVVLWWPKGPLSHALLDQDGPDTLLAMVIALGATLAYYSVRAGAEEILLAEQNPLREWVIATPLALTRILGGYFCGLLLHTLYAIGLSFPLLLTAYSVGGGEWRSVGWCLATVLIQSIFYWLVGAVVYTAVGHYDRATFFSVRLVLLVGYAATPTLFSAASHPFVSSYLLTSYPPMTASSGSAPLHLIFLLFYCVLVVVLLVVLYALLRRLRSIAPDRS